MVTWVGELGQFRSFNTLTPRWHQTCSRGLVGQVAYEGHKGGAEIDGKSFQLVIKI